MKTDFFNTRLDLLDYEEALERCSSFYSSDRCHTLFFLNAHCFNIAQKDSEYARAIYRSDLLLNDGIGIRLGSYLAGIDLKQNMNGTDFIPKVLDHAATVNLPVYFMGGRPGVAEKASRRAMELIAGLKVVGWHSGYFSANQEPSILDKINQSGAKILVLGMGVPKQELWAENNMKRLNNVRLIIGGGAILDFLSGEVNRAPLWIRKIHMEWLYRFFLEPSRMFHRYTTGIFLYFYHILRLFPRRKTAVNTAR